jgi:hypothetical protein
LNAGSPSSGSALSSLLLAATTTRRPLRLGPPREEGKAKLLRLGSAGMEGRRDRGDDAEAEVEQGQGQPDMAARGVCCLDRQ